jgi:ABC-type polysaccharide/polyol phosphate export permease
MGDSRIFNASLDALRSSDIWCYLAWQDIRLRYRRSKIGPFWITLSMSIFCVALGLIYSRLFKAEIKEYLPFLTIGFVFWTWISGMLGEFPNIFVENSSYIKDIKINPLTILFRIAARHIIILVHNIVIVVAIWLYFGINPGVIGLLVFPGLLLVLANLMTIGIVLSIFGARFRDIAPITQSLLQLVFFITPLTWLPRLLSADSWIIWLNPVASYVDLLRSPLLGHAPESISWIISMSTFLIFLTLASVIYCRKASKVPFWV